MIIITPLMQSDTYHVDSITQSRQRESIGVNVPVIFSLIYNSLSEKPPKGYKTFPIGSGRSKIACSRARCNVSPRRKVS